MRAIAGPAGWRKGRIPDPLAEALPDLAAWQVLAVGPSAC
jgi:hypothetical protein